MTVNGRFHWRLLALLLSVAGCGPEGVPGSSPMANAGADQTVVSGETVSLSAAGSAAAGGRTLAEYRWTKISGPDITLNGVDTERASFVVPVTRGSSQQIQIRLMVRDNRGDAATDTVVITVANPGSGSVNAPPTAHAGADQTVASGSTVTLSGSGVAASGRTIAEFIWARLSGPAVTLNNANTASASFVAPTVSSGSQSLEFRLQVRDSRGESATDTVVITVVPSTGATVTVSGTATYDRVPFNPGTHGLDYNAIVVRPIRGATVQLLDAGAASVLATATSTAAGGYSFSSVPAQTQVQVRVRAELAQTGAPSWDFKVVDNTNGGALYVLDSGVFNTGTVDVVRPVMHAASGWGGSSYTATRAAAPFAILDSVFAAMQKVLSADGFADFSPLLLNWSLNNRPVDGNLAAGQIGTSFYSSGNIYVLGDDDTDTDEYDGHVLIHEFGHYLEDAFSRLDSLGGSHGSGDRLDPRVAYSEGFSNAWSGIVTDDPFYRDSSGSQQASGFSINVEANPPSDKFAGWFSEDSVQSLIFDLYDSAGAGDSDGDTVTLGFGPIYDALINEQRGTTAFSTIFPLLTALKANNGTQASAINALAGARGVNGTDDFAVGESNSSDATMGDVLPLFAPVTVPSTTSGVCTLKAYGEFNKLSNRRFLTFTLPSDRIVSVRVDSSPGRDPDLVVRRGGAQQAIAEDNSSSNGTQVLNNVPLTAGTYVLEVYDALNVDFNDNTGGRVCFTVSLS